MAFLIAALPLAFFFSVSALKDMGSMRASAISSSSASC